MPATSDTVHFADDEIPSDRREKTRRNEGARARNGVRFRSWQLLAPSSDLVEQPITDLSQIRNVLVTRESYPNIPKNLQLYLFISIFASTCWKKVEIRTLLLVYYATLTSIKIEISWSMLHESKIRILWF